MTLADYQHFVNRTATLDNAIPGFHVTVRITDVRSAFGRIDVRVTPVAGFGECWVNANRVVITGEKS